MTHLRFGTETGQSFRVKREEATSVVGDFSQRVTSGACWIEPRLRGEVLDGPRGSPWKVGGYGGQTRW
jgi:hypothetical protein